MKIDNLLTELKRRNVYKVAVAYAVVGWLIAQIATQSFPFLEIPNWIIRLVVVLIAIGFPIALVIAWVAYAVVAWLLIQVPRRSFPSSRFPTGPCDWSCWS